VRAAQSSGAVLSRTDHDRMTGPETRFGTDALENAMGLMNGLLGNAAKVDADR
jgi:hypothetical protein